jgi:hypothetical protein
MNQIGSYYFGLDYNTNYWRVSMFPFSFCFTVDDIFGIVFEVSIFHFKIFIGSKTDDKF